MPLPAAPGQLPNSSRGKGSLRIRSKCFGTSTVPISPFGMPVPRVEPEQGFLTHPIEGHTLRDLFWQSSPNKHLNTVCCVFLVPEHQFQNGSCGCVFIGAKPAWEAQRERDAPMFAKQPRSHFHGKTSELFLFFLGESGVGRRGANTGISRRIQMLGFQHLS